jgi:hypothetical protein
VSSVAHGVIVGQSTRSGAATYVLLCGVFVSRDEVPGEVVGEAPRNV